MATKSLVVSNRALSRARSASAARIALMSRETLARYRRLPTESLMEMIVINTGISRPSNALIKLSPLHVPAWIAFGMISFIVRATSRSGTIVAML